VQLHQQAQKRLEQLESELADLQERLRETRDHWAKARGDADIALKTLDDLQTKQKKRWAELTGVSDQAENSDAIDIPLSVEPVEQARKIIELDHKLKQALENVRQADAVRQNLKEALAMNSTLQGKLDEIKGKYAALQAGRSNSASNSKSSSTEATNHVSGSSRDKPEKAESSSKSEKLHRENRRMRKEMAALSASKDAAKAKLEVRFSPELVVWSLKGYLTRNILFNQSELKRNEMCSRRQTPDS
jgi:chromosome segregation ATPase